MTGDSAIVMPGPGSSPGQALVPGIHEPEALIKFGNGRNAPGHDPVWIGAA